MAAPKSPTVGDLVNNLGVDLSREGLDWPPDAFAVAATVLKKTGAYTTLVHRWPPASGSGDWLDQIAAVGEAWRAATSIRTRPGEPPQPVKDWWQTVLDRLDTPLDAVDDDEPLCHALLQLCIAADEACHDVGVPSGGQLRESDKFDARANDNLTTGTLAEHVSATRVRVLPKLHTPTSGMTLRSLTHNLALCPVEDVRTSWRMLSGGPEEGRGLNLLLLPWPRLIAPRQFAEVKDHQLLTMPARFGFFRFESDVDTDGVVAEAMAAFDAAERLVGKVHGVILPELALTPAAHGRLREAVTGKGAFLISGVGERGNAPSFDSNYLMFDVPTFFAVSSVRQEKHHRWKLSRSQILQYGCAANLSHTREWWEFIGMGRRELTFVSMNPWLTMSVLICEDLARQDPVAEILRAVGPNLVIALLMDGPQLAARWPARYATVLADDPGSSVLTLTSIGMAQLSRPPGKPPSRVIALWKDAVTAEPREISLPEGADAVLLTISAENHEEWAADGRSDNEATGYPVLAGVHPISAGSSRPDTLARPSEKR